MKYFQCSWSPVQEALPVFKFSFFCIKNGVWERVDKKEIIRNMYNEKIFYVVQ